MFKMYYCVFIVSVPNVFNIVRTLQISSIALGLPGSSKTVFIAEMLIYMYKQRLSV